MQQKVDRDLSAWEKKAVNDIKKKGKVYRKFESDFIDEDVYHMIENGLNKANSADEVKKIFAELKKIEDQKYTALDEFEKTEEYRKFLKAVKKSLKKQLKPFTSAEIVGEFNKMAKDKESDAAIDAYIDSFDFYGLKQYLIEAAVAGGKNAFDQLGISENFKPSPLVQEMVSDRENYLIKSVDDTTKDWIVRQITNGKENAMTNDEIAKLISENIDDITDKRAKTIVNTEVANAMQQAELITYKEQGVGQKIWRTSSDEAVCPICKPLDGKVTGVDDSFIAGVTAAPAHPNCRCYIQADISSIK
jgi:SPP1 gp7 family putative phage head morphogenesis protein